MKFKEWLDLQKEYKVGVYYADYENLDIESGRQLLESIVDKFERIHNDNSGDDENL